MSIRLPARLFRIAVVGSTVALVFGGTIVDGHAQAVTLNWGSISTSAAPAGREFAAMDFDSVRGRTVMFGGDSITPGSSAPTPPLGDTWEWNGGSWVQRAPVTSPPALTTAAMAFDSARGVSILFGGTNFTSPFGQTWEWDGTTWTEQFPATSPSPRVWTAMAYDSARGRMVLFGGSGSAGSESETWEYDGTSWTQRFPTTSPPARYGAAMAYDSSRHVTVMFGGHTDTGSRLDDTWEWDGGNWTQRASAAVPYPRQFTSMAFDSALGKTILFGGDHLQPVALGPVNDTWLWDGNQWTQDWTDAAPEPRLGQAMAYDSVRDRTVMFGGTEGGSPQFVYPVDTWELGGGIVTPTGTPDAAFANFNGLNSQPYGTTSAPAYEILRSTGTGPLHIASMSITGDFAIAGTDCPLAPNPLAAGMYCSIAVTFTPTATGTRTGTLTVSDDGSGLSQQATLSATGVAIATSLTVDPATVVYGRAAVVSATLTVSGQPLFGAPVAFTLPNGANATVLTDTNGVAAWSGANVTGLHAGYYFDGVHATFAGDANHLGSSGSAPLAISQLGSLSYDGAFYVSDATAPMLTVTVGQSIAGSDPQPFDFSRLPVYVDVKVTGPGGAFESTALVADAPDWSTTGRGVVSVSSAALADGAYVVNATFAPAFYPYAGIEFVTGEDARAAVVSSPTLRGFASGGGAIAADPSANTADAHGYFAFELTPGRTPGGNLVYLYRSRMDIGGTSRDVDVQATNTDVTSLTGNQQAVSASGHFRVAFIDAESGVRYSALEFTGGTFALSASNATAKSAAGFALTLRRPDGTLFHATAALTSRGDTPTVPVTLGAIVCSL